MTNIPPNERTINDIGSGIKYTEVTSQEIFDWHSPISIKRELRWGQTFNTRGELGKDILFSADPEGSFNCHEIWLTELPFKRGTLL